MKSRNMAVGSLSLTDVMARYRFPESTAKGVTIGVIEFGGGFHQSDVDAFCKSLGVDAPTIEIAEIKGHRGDNQPLDVETLAAIVGALGEPGATFEGVMSQYPEASASFQDTWETTLDMEFVAGIAPEAGIKAYFASGSVESWVSVLDQCLSDEVDVVTCSWGEAEATLNFAEGSRDSYHRVDEALERLRKAGITVCVSSGDYGSRRDSSLDEASVEYPASSPHVLACGGTYLVPEGGEEVFNHEWLGLRLASGGGMSGVFGRPARQAHVPTPSPTPGIWTQPGEPEGFVGRWMPDVAANADPRSGVRIILGGVPYIGFGTSAAAPLWAGLIARLTARIGKPLGWLPERLYPTRDQGHDPAGLEAITVGNNDCPPGRGSVRYFEAGPVYNACTGLGSPDGERLLAWLQSSQ